MNTQDEFRIYFENLSLAEANRKISGLRNALLDITPDISAEIRKDHQSTQDFGSTLVLVLGAPAMVIIARGIADYLSRVGGTITIEDRNGRVIAKSIQSKDVARIAEAFSQMKKDDR